MVRVVGTSDLEQPKSLARAINVTRNTASTKIPASFDSDPIGCGRGELSHWFHGPQVSFTIFRTACSPQHLISGLGFRGTRAVRFLSLSLSFSLWFSLGVQRIVRGPCTLPDSFPFVGNNAPLPNDRSLAPFARLFIITQLFIAAVSPASTAPIVL